MDPITGRKKLSGDRPQEVIGFGELWGPAGTSGDHLGTQIYQNIVSYTNPHHIVSYINPHHIVFYINPHYIASYINPHHIGSYINPYYIVSYINPHIISHSYLHMSTKTY